MPYKYYLTPKLKELVDIGLTPFEALKASTTHPREYLGELGEAGTIVVGKRAELLLLAANPLENIANTRKIMGVMYKRNWLNQDLIFRFS